MSSLILCSFLTKMQSLAIGMAIHRHEHYLVHAARETWWRGADENLAVVLLRYDNGTSCKPQHEAAVGRPRIEWLCDLSSNGTMTGPRAITRRVHALWQHLLALGREFCVKVRQLAPMAVPTPLSSSLFMSSWPGGRGHLHLPRKSGRHAAPTAATGTRVCWLSVTHALDGWPRGRCVACVCHAAASSVLLAGHSRADDPGRWAMPHGSALHLDSCTRWLPAP